MKKSTLKRILSLKGNDSRMLGCVKDARRISKSVGIRLDLRSQSKVRFGVQVELQLKSFVILIWFEVFIDSKDYCKRCYLYRRMHKSDRVKNFMT